MNDPSMLSVRSSDARSVLVPSMAALLLVGCPTEVTVGAPRDAGAPADASPATSDAGGADAAPTPTPLPTPEQVLEPAVAAPRSIREVDIATDGDSFLVAYSTADREVFISRVDATGAIADAPTPIATDVQVGPVVTYMARVGVYVVVWVAPGSAGSARWRVLAGLVDPDTGLLTSVSDLEMFGVATAPEVALNDGLAVGITGDGELSVAVTTRGADGRRLYFSGAGRRGDWQAFDNTRGSWPQTLSIVATADSAYVFFGSYEGIERVSIESGDRELVLATDGHAHVGNAVDADDGGHLLFFTQYEGGEATAVRGLRLDATGAAVGAPFDVTGLSTTARSRSWMLPSAVRVGDNAWVARPGGDPGAIERLATVSLSGDTISETDFAVPGEALTVWDAAASDSQVVWALGSRESPAGTTFPFDTRGLLLATTSAGAAGIDEVHAVSTPTEREEVRVRCGSERCVVSWPARHEGEQTVFLANAFDAQTGEVLHPEPLELGTAWTRGLLVHDGLCVATDGEQFRVFGAGGEEDPETGAIPLWTRVGDGLTFEEARVVGEVDAGQHPSFDCAFDGESYALFHGRGRSGPALSVRRMSPSGEWGTTRSLDVPDFERMSVASDGTSVGVFLPTASTSSPSVFLRIPAGETEPDVVLPMEVSFPQSGVTPAAFAAQAGEGYAVLVSLGDRYDVIHVDGGEVTSRGALDSAQGTHVAPLLAGGAEVAALYGLEELAGDRPAAPFLTVFDRGAQVGERRALESDLEVRAAAWVRLGALAVVYQREAAFGSPRGPLSMRIISVSSPPD